MSKEKAKEIIEKLVERFSEHQKEYHLSDYNEQKARQDFINPFFKALGWDVDNEKGDSEAYREVIYEDKVVVKGKAKAPDYGFRLAGSGSKRLFYVEAKKPSVPIKTHKESAYQLRRYGSSAQAFVSILTNFEDFIVYDCSKVPKIDDSASVARLKHVHFTDYIKEFDFIYDTFSHDAITKGRFDKFVQNDANKKGSQTLDKEFVQSLDSWRKYLAVNFAVNNRKLDDAEINFAVQQTLDRLIFLRFCEDRAVEPYGQLQKAVVKGDAYKNLFTLFKLADDKYNSGLFDFKKDQLTAKLKIDNKAIKAVIEELYYPLCRYEFSVMPVEVLGNAYEQFLGKVIRVTPSRMVKIEEKPEVRKAGGVFYTPQYIVDYIVKNTIGKLLHGSTPKDAEKIKVIDPACGSGSFLLGAYQYFLDWHLNYHFQELKRLNKLIEGKSLALKDQNHAIKERSGIPLTPDGKLTTKIKKQILTNNIFGVDLDANAVEVSKLSLLLKCLEGETEASVKTITLNLNDRVLPNLDENIKNGNSLVETDFYDEEFDLGYAQTIKPFSWKKGFADIFKNGGFDVVIGNPPYIPIEIFSDEEKGYYKSRYPVLSRKYDSSVLFILKGFELLNQDGALAYISTQTWQTGENYGDFRKKIIQQFGIKEIINLPFNVFKDAYVDTGIFIFSKRKSQSYNFYSFEKKAVLDKIESLSYEKVKMSDLKAPDFKIVLNNSTVGILSKFAISKYKPLGEISISTQGLSASRFPESDSKSGKWILPYINATVKRYAFTKEKQHTTDLEDMSSLHKFYTAQEKILIRRIINRQNRLDATYFDQKGVFKKDLNPFIITDKNFHTKYVLGVLNSKFFSWLYINTSSIATKDDFRQTTLSELRKLPIKKIDSKSKNAKHLHDVIVKNVDTILSLTEELKSTKLQAKIDQLRQRIDHAEETINQSVYKLYELKEEDIKLIEEAII